MTDATVARPRPRRSRSSGRRAAPRRGARCSSAAAPRRARPARRTRRGLAARRARPQRDARRVRERRRAPARARGGLGRRPDARATLRPSPPAPRACRSSRARWACSSAPRRRDEAVATAPPNLQTVGHVVVDADRSGMGRTGGARAREALRPAAGDAPLRPGLGRSRVLAGAVRGRGAGGVIGRDESNSRWWGADVGTRHRPAFVTLAPAQRAEALAPYAWAELRAPLDDAPDPWDAVRRGLRLLRCAGGLPHPAGRAVARLVRGTVSRSCRPRTPRSTRPPCRSGRSPTSASWRCAARRPSASASATWRGRASSPPSIPRSRCTCCATASRRAGSAGGPLRAASS